jgi:hypothetical protein
MTDLEGNGIKCTSIFFLKSLLLVNWEPTMAVFQDKALVGLYLAQSEAQ